MMLHLGLSALLPSGGEKTGKGAVVGENERIQRLRAPIFMRITILTWSKKYFSVILGSCRNSLTAMGFICNFAFRLRFFNPFL
jgi:hypothetical protein